MRDSGSELKNVLGIAPQSTAVAVSGGSVDRKDYESGVVSLFVGSATGSPSSFEIAAQAQEAETVGIWSNISSGSVTVTSANTLGELNINLNSVKRYMRVVVTPTFVGGSNPAIPIASIITLGQAKYGPAV